MPIRELTERPNIPRLGKIRLGVKDPQRGFPKNVKHFVVPEEVAKALGTDEPTELHIVFLTDDMDRNASQYYRAYNATSGLICRGDGYSADALLDGDVLSKNGGELTVDAWAHGATSGREKATSKFVRQQINCAGGGYDGQPPCPMFAAKKCAIRNFMQFAIRDVPGLGVYQMDTGSVINTRNINGTLEMTRLMLGGVAGVPMVLRRTELEVAPDGKKKKVWGVTLEADTQYSLANLIEMRRGPLAAALLPEGAAALLPPVDESEVYEDPGDGEDEDDEPAPEKPAAEVAAPSDLLNRIKDKHGAERAGEARGILPVHFGTMDLLKLTNEQRAEAATFLRVWLEDPEHQHDAAMLPESDRIACRLCGLPMTEDDLPFETGATTGPAAPVQPTLG